MLLSRASIENQNRVITKKKCNLILLQIEAISKVDRILKTKEHRNLTESQFNLLNSPAKRKELKLRLKNLNRGLSEYQSSKMPKRLPIDNISNSYQIDKIIYPFGNIFEIKLIAVEI